MLNKFAKLVLNFTHRIIGVLTNTNTLFAAHLYHSKYRPDIDGLRAIAVLSVVLFHAFPSWLRYDKKHYLQGGFIGVDIFFVISGFLISTIIFNSLETNNFSFREFYTKRIKRIFPSLIIVLIASIFFGWIILSPSEYKQLGKHIIGAATYTNNFIFWKESGYFDVAGETKPLLHLWSLSIEEQFYIVWPFLLWICFKKHINLLTVTLVLVFISFALHLFTLHTDKVAAFYAPQLRMWELLIGSTVAYVKFFPKSISPKIIDNIKRFANINYNFSAETGINKKTIQNFQSIFGLALILLGLVLIKKESDFPGFWALLFPVLGSALIIGATEEAWVNRKVLSNKILVWFGLISYPLYLWHWPLISFAIIIEGDTPSKQIRIAVVLISILLASITYYAIEKPIRFNKEKNNITLILLFLMVLIGFVGWGLHKSNGLSFRINKSVNDFMVGKYDYRDSFREGTCFLRPEQNYGSFSMCDDAISTSVKKTILIWGDSHAAHLYSGYKKIFGEKFNIKQRTASVCPPILMVDNFDRPFCLGINNFIISEIKKSPPDIIVLSAAWSKYNFSEIQVSINELKKISTIEKIYLIGPVPQWRGSLEKQMYKHFRLYNALPYYMNTGLEIKKNKEIDLQLSKIAEINNINYISPLQILCNKDGCLTRVSGKELSLTAFDYGHLTIDGSEFLVSYFSKK